MTMNNKQTNTPPLKIVNFSINEDDEISVSNEEEEDKKDYPSDKKEKMMCTVILARIIKSSDLMLPFKGEQDSPLSAQDKTSVNIL
eukprot:6231116-Ditylum_brightwellii.AAC.1